MREIEEIIIERERKRKVLRHLLTIIGDHRVIKDCKAHLAELDHDITYIPVGCTVSYMMDIRKR